MRNCEYEKARRIVPIQRSQQGQLWCLCLTDQLLLQSVKRTISVPEVLYSGFTYSIITARVCSIKTQGNFPSTTCSNLEVGLSDLQKQTVGRAQICLDEMNDTETNWTQLSLTIQCCVCHCPDMSHFSGEALTRISRVFTKGFLASAPITCAFP